MNRTAQSTLADLIETRLFGVDPQDQDLQLEDHDWRLIVSALRGMTTPNSTVEAVAETIIENAKKGLSQLNTLIDEIDEIQHRELTGKITNRFNAILEAAAAMPAVSEGNGARIIEGLQEAVAISTSTDHEKIIGELVEVAHNVAMAAGALNVATDGDEDLRDERLCVLETLKHWSATLIKHGLDRGGK